MTATFLNLVFRFLLRATHKKAKKHNKRDEQIQQLIHTGGVFWTISQ